jgi:hypothetical protein
LSSDLLMKTKRQYLGEPFGQWKVIGLPFRISYGKAQKTRPHVVCECVCGAVEIVLCQNLVNGRSSSCGCQPHPNKTHGGKGTPIYKVWSCMKERCKATDPKRAPRYLNRGIAVCPEWAEDFPVFRDWAEANGYRHGLQIDRIDNDKGYSPDNCHFVTAKENNQNKSTNVYLTLFGERKTIKAWSEDLRCRVKHSTLHRRLSKGVDPETAVTTPVGGLA